MDKAYTTTIRKVGNSLAIIIPVPVLKGHKMKRGDTVIFGHIDDSTFAVRKVPKDFFINIKPS